MPKPDPVERLPLSLPVFQILLSLSVEPMHGYALLTDIRERTDTTVQLGAGTLYAAIRRMGAAGMIEECDPPTLEDGVDARRKFYRITDHGRELAMAEARRIRRLNALASARIPLDDELVEPTRG